MGPYWPSDIIEGNYTCFLSTGSDPVESEKTVDATIWQNGTVPANAQSLRFKGRIAGGPNPPSKTFAVYLGGQELSLSPLLVTSGYTLYGADVSQFSGRAAELRITSFWLSGPTGLWVDSLEFSPDVVPEPGAWALAGLGAFLAVSASAWDRPNRGREVVSRAAQFPPK